MGHHYVPQRYLRNFAALEDDRHIWLHVRGSKAAKLVPIKAAAQAPKFYADEEERRLARDIESPGNAAIRSLVENGRLTSDERQHIAAYIGVMLMRVPRRRTKAEGLIPTVLDEIVSEARSALEEALRVTGPNDAVVRTKLAELEEVAAEFRIAPPQSVVDQIRSPFPREHIVDLLHSMCWRVVHTGTAPFVTSDNPVFLFESLGLGRAESEFSFPISTNFLLHGNHLGDRKVVPSVEATGALVRELNNRTFMGSERLCFSSRQDLWLLSSRPLHRPLRRWVA